MKDRDTTRRQVLMFVALVALATLAAVRWKAEHREVPSELIGMWRTTDERYADRSMEIGHGSITFATGGGTESTGFIDDVQWVPDRAAVLYTISYWVNEEHEQISFYYEEADGRGRIRLKNQPGVLWDMSASR